MLPQVMLRIWVPVLSVALCTRLARRSAERRMALGEGGIRSREEAQGHFGLFALFASIDVPASSELTRKQFGWNSGQPGLIADLDEGRYFRD